MSEVVDRNNLDPDIVRELGRVDVIAKVLADSTRLGLHRSKHKGSGTDFSEYKSYVPGDDLRHLDWKLFARTDKLYVRRFETHANMEVHILVDGSRSMAWRWQEHVNKLEYAINLAAAMGELYLQQQDQVALSTWDAEGFDHLPASSKVQQVERMASRLEALEGAEGGGLLELVSRTVELKRMKGPILLFSDLEDDAEEVERALDHLAGLEEDVIVFQILDQFEVELPFKNLTHLEDVETGQAFPVHYASLREEHSKRVEEFFGHWRSLCQKRGMVHLDLHTGMNYLDVLLDVMESLEEKG